MVQELRRFVVERRVPEMASDALLELHVAVQEAVNRSGGVDSQVVWVRTLYVPSTERWIAVFAAGTPDVVHRAVKIAQLPPGEVHEAVEMTGG